jgi:hypothetical protein
MKPRRLRIGVPIAALLVACGGSTSQEGETTHRDLTDGGELDGPIAETGTDDAATADTSAVLDVATEAAAPDAAPDVRVACSTPLAGPSAARALTNSEYDRTVRDLLQDASGPASGFTDDQRIGVFRVAPANQLSDMRIAQMAATAEQLAQNALARLSSLLPCDPAAGEDACAKQFVTTFGLRAFRRPLTADEATEFFRTYAGARPSSDFAHGIAAVIASMLKSPHFYQIEEARTPGLAPLEPYRMASRLSYFIYRSMPDPPLFDAAAAGKLATPEDIASQALRMLDNPKAHDGVVEFFSEWLGLDTMGDLFKNDSVTFDFVTLRGYMRTETTSFVESVFFGSRKWNALLESPETFLNEPLAQLYEAAPITGLAFQKATLDMKTRGGILTQASILSLTGTAVESSPTLRGLFVRQRLLCQEIPPPPANIPPLPPLAPGQTNRERYEVMTKEPVCGACHQLMDGIGYGFEQFDAIGRFRTLDNGAPVDSSGMLTQTDVDGPFTGARELSTKLVSSKTAKECIATQWFRFALGRMETEADACSLATAKNALSSTGDLRELVIAIATSDAFRYADFRP